MASYNVTPGLMKGRFRIPKVQMRLSSLQTERLIASDCTPGYKSIMHLQLSSHGDKLFPRGNEREFGNWRCNFISKAVGLILGSFDSPNKPASLRPKENLPQFSEELRIPE
ncbi:hypothetical protein KM043_003748 [Ampulex compressa]|nr:hypothetical protein KM043_003748 [Ampulex compressa]